MSRDCVAVANILLFCKYVLIPENQLTTTAQARTFHNVQLMERFYYSDQTKAVLYLDVVRFVFCLKSLSENIIVKSQKLKEIQFETQTTSASLFLN